MNKEIFVLVIIIGLFVALGGTYLFSTQEVKLNDFSKNIRFVNNENYESNNFETLDDLDKNVYSKSLIIEDVNRYISPSDPRKLIEEVTKGVTNIYNYFVDMNFIFDANFIAGANRVIITNSDGELGVDDDLKYFDNQNWLVNSAVLSDPFCSGSYSDYCWFNIYDESTCESVNGCNWFNEGYCVDYYGNPSCYGTLSYDCSVLNQTDCESYPAYYECYYDYGLSECLNYGGYCEWLSGNADVCSLMGCQTEYCNTYSTESNCIANLSGLCFWEDMSFCDGELSCDNQDNQTKCDIVKDLTGQCDWDLNKTFSKSEWGQFISTAEQGHAPLIVDSNTKVENLNADLLDGFNSSDFLQSSNFGLLSATSPVTVTGGRYVLGGTATIGIGTTGTMSCTSGINCTSRTVLGGSSSITHSTASGYKHVASGGSVGDLLYNTADGIASWSNVKANSNSLYNVLDLNLLGSTNFFNLSNARASISKNDVNDEFRVLSEQIVLDGLSYSVTANTTADISSSSNIMVNHSIAWWQKGIDTGYLLDGGDVTSTGRYIKFDYSGGVYSINYYTRGTSKVWNFPEPPTDWTRCFLVRNTNGTLQFYVNGVLVSNLTGGTGYAVSIVNMFRNMTNTEFKEVNFWSDSKNQDFVTLDYASGKGLYYSNDSANLVHAWHFDEGSGTTATDSKNSFVLTANFDWVLENEISQNTGYNAFNVVKMQNGEGIEKPVITFGDLNAITFIDGNIIYLGGNKVYVKPDGNLVLTSPDLNVWNCGVGNNGVFSCS